MSHFWLNEILAISGRKRVELNEEKALGWIRCMPVWKQEIDSTDGLEMVGRRLFENLQYVLRCFEIHLNGEVSADLEKCVLGVT